MILDEYLRKKALAFMRCSGITANKNKISAYDAERVKRALVCVQISDRMESRRISEKNKYKINTSIETLLGGLKVESPIEEVLRDALLVEGMGQLLRTQFQIGTKRVDFAFPIAKLVVEADGKEYHHANVNQLEKDLLRDKYLARKGWRVMHIEGVAIRRNIMLCVELIKKQLQPYSNTCTQQQEVTSGTCTAK